jgi:lipoate-protein ligase A
MAIDTAMLASAETTGRTLIRLYRWAPFCLSFGRHEPATRRYNVDLIRARGHDCVRRPTGGRAVWHARELTYAVAAPTAGLGDLAAAFATIHQWLAAALGRLGAEATTAPPHGPAALAAGPCFANAVGGELVVAGFKVLGSAQRRGHGALLQHGSLLLEDDQSEVRAMLIGGGAVAPAAEAPLSRLIGRVVSFTEAADAVRDEVVGRDLAALVVVPPEDVAANAALHFERYQSDSWTWHR